MNISSLWHKASEHRWAILTALTLCASSYLCLVNLDYSLLWEDEANTAIIGNNLLNTGTLTAWDGRNLISDRNGMNLNSKLQEVLPPLQYAISALGISMFGYNEVGARSVHAFIGILALIMFLLLLKQHFPDNARLRCLIFMFVALSPQLLLYFRSARYFAFAVFSFIACFYFYEHYWRSNRYRHLIGMTIFGLLGFLNHYSMGAAGVLSIAFYHLLLREPDTSKKQWLMFSLAGLFVAILGSSYLYFQGVLPMDHEMNDFYKGDNPRSLASLILKSWWGIKTVFGYGWLSWFISGWFLVYCAISKYKKKRSYALLVINRFLFIGGLLFFFANAISPHEKTYSRIFISSLPFFLVMNGMLVNLLISKSKLIAAAALVSLLISSASTLPLNIININTGESTQGFHLISLIKEIHHPYRPDPIDEVVKYLIAHAKQDDLVYIPDRYGHRQNLIPYIGDKVFLCCQIDKEHPRLAFPISKLRTSLFLDPEVIPDWIIVFSPKVHSSNWKLFQHSYHRNYSFLNIPIMAEQTQRPELAWHTFEPYLIPRHGGVHILKRKDSPASPDTWF